MTSTAQLASLNETKEIDLTQPLVNNESHQNNLLKEKTLDDYVHLSHYALRILMFSEFVLLSVMGNIIYMVYAGAEPRVVRCVDERSAVIEANVCKGNYSNDYHLLDPKCSFEFDTEFHTVNVDMAGVLIGAPLFGHLSDQYGRKKILVWCFVLCSIFQILASFSYSLFTFTVLRMIVGFFNGGQMSIFGVYQVEHIPKNHRVWISALISFAPNFIIMNGIAYLSGDWVTFQRALVAASIPALFISFFLHESPRWLLGRGQIAEAERVLLDIQRIDGKTKHKDGLSMLLQLEFEKAEARMKKAKNYSMHHLFYTADMAKATLTLALGMLLTSMINYGLMFNLEKLSGSIFLNSTYLGLLRWLLNSILGILDYKYKQCGRKPFHLLAQLASTSCLCVVAVAYWTGKSEDWAESVRVSVLLASAVCSQVYLSKGITAMEYWPSVVRNMGIAFNSTWSRVGTILAPLMFRVHQSKGLPFTLMAIMALADAVLFQIYLPETKGRPMEDGLPRKEKKSRKNEEIA